MIIKQWYVQALQSHLAAFGCAHSVARDAVTYLYEGTYDHETDSARDYLAAIWSDPADLEDPDGMEAKHDMDTLLNALDAFGDKARVDRSIAVIVRAALKDPA